MPNSYDAMNTGLLLHIPYRYLEEHILQALADRGLPISAAQARVFQRIGPAGSRPVDLASATGLTKQSVGFLLDQLEAAGYITRESHPADGRVRLAKVSPRGARLVAESLPIIERAEQEWADLLGAEEYARLRRSLAVLSAHTDRHAGPA